MSDEGFVSEAEYQNHQPWCRARRFGRLNADACNCDLSKRDPLHGIPAIIGTSEDFPLTHRPGEYMGIERDTLTTEDREQLKAIIRRLDDDQCVRLIVNYWRDADRSDRTPREYLILHLGMVCGMCERLLERAAHGETLDDPQFLRLLHGWAQLTPWERSWVMKAFDAVQNKS